MLVDMPPRSPSDDSEEESVGDRLRRLRTERGLTLRALGARANVAYSYVSALEQGHKANPSVAVARRLAAALGITVDALFPAEHEEEDDDA